MTIALPRYKETVVIILVDKYCGLMETIIPRLLAIKNVLQLKRHKRVINQIESNPQLYLELKKHD